MAGQEAGVWPCNILFCFNSLNENLDLSTSENVTSLELVLEPSRPLFRRLCLNENLVVPVNIRKYALTSLELVIGPSRQLFLVVLDVVRNMETTMSYESESIRRQITKPPHTKRSKIVLVTSVCGGRKELCGWRETGVVCVSTFTKICVSPVLKLLVTVRSYKLLKHNF